MTSEQPKPLCEITKQGRAATRVSSYQSTRLWTSTRDGHQYKALFERDEVDSILVRREVDLKLVRLLKCSLADEDAAHVRAMTDALHADLADMLQALVAMPLYDIRALVTHEDLMDALLVNTEARALVATLAELAWAYHDAKRVLAQAVQAPVNEQQGFCAALAMGFSLAPRRADMRRNCEGFAKIGDALFEPGQNQEQRLHALKHGVSRTYLHNTYNKTAFAGAAHARSIAPAPGRGGA